MFFITNEGDQAYDGTVHLPVGGAAVADPWDGSVREAEGKAGGLRLSLGPGDARLFVCDGAPRAAAPRPPVSRGRRKPLSERRVPPGGS